MYLIVIFALFSVTIGTPHHGRIYGGTDASPGQFPFAVAINDTTQVCDGVILNNKWVLTAAQCVLFLSNDTVIVAGDVSISTGTAFNIIQLIAHEEYDPATGQNDIGLIELESELTFDDKIQPIEIGEVGDDQTCTALGWGISVDDPFPDVLQFVETTTLNVDQCKDLASEVWDGLFIGTETVCTLSGNEDMGVCYGDAGGPLICDGKLAAVISYTVEVCGGQYPDVYVRTSSYVDWIQSHISDSHF